MPTGGELPETRSGGLLFGTAGIPHSTPEPKTTQGGIARLHELGLGCMEVAFVEGVYLNPKSARAVGETARNRGIKLTAHAPYFINLNSREEKKVQDSCTRILQTARIAHAFGGDGIAFHAAFYMKDSPETVYQKVKRHLAGIVDQLDKEGKRVLLRPEIMGKPSQFGTLHEVLRLSSEVEGVAPCIDFAHLHARTGKFNTYNEFSQVLDQIGEKLGRQGLDALHVHVSGIEYGPKGETRHQNLRESDFRYVELLQALKDHRVVGIAVCESPNLEEDALHLLGIYRTSA